MSNGALNLSSVIKAGTMKLLREYGYTLCPLIPPDLDSEVKTTIRAVSPYTATSVERQMCLIDSVKYIERYRIAGDIIECGVYRGGSIMAAALTLLNLKSTD